MKSTLLIVKGYPLFSDLFLEMGVEIDEHYPFLHYLE